jgi:glycerol-3-phosphate acyltransferase PlsY
MLWLLLPLGYLAGSIPFGLLLGKLRGIDIREKGSGNIGSTNVFRILGKKSGILCLILDVLKGFLPVLFAYQTVPDDTVGDTIEVLTALAAILGHNYSPWIGFKGGKGIATTGGALIALMPATVLILVVIFLIVTLATRFVSLGSIATGIALPVITAFWSYRAATSGDGPADDWNKPLFLFSLVAGILAVWKHRSNLARLRAGTEHRIGQKEKDPAA